MTQKGESNHYNVKFLKGYGFSISVKDSKVVLKNSYDPFKESEVESWYVKNMPYEKIVLSGKGYISTEALSLLCQNNRNLILLDTYGKPISYLNPVMESNTATQYRIGQYDTFRNLEKKKYLAKQIVKAKIESQIRFLESTKDPAVKNGIEKDVVMMHTDSICCKKKLDVNSKKLGEFSLDFEGSVYALQSGFYSKNGKWKSRGIGQLGDDTILHKDTFVDEKGRIKYSFDKVRVGTIKRNILEGTIDKIGRFEKQTKNLNINADRGRMWWGRLTDVRKKEHNVSTPFDLSVFEYSKI